MKKNLRTTIGGILAAVGGYLVTQTGVEHLVGQVLQAIGIFFLGYSAQDAPPMDLKEKED